ncbi:MAG: hypothetical protein IKN54_02300 [Lachnospiraceae bacterium]|nr:hypothetical protein [Lachnospiraceae bacterium]
MAYVRVNNKIFFPTPEEQDAHGIEETLDRAVKVGEITAEAAVEMYKLWFTY